MSYFVNFLPFILFFVYIHDIPSYLVIIIYQLYYSFLLLPPIDFPKTPDILEFDDTILCLTEANKYDFIYFSLIVSGLSIIPIKISAENTYVSSYIKFSGVLILT